MLQSHFSRQLHAAATFGDVRQKVGVLLFVAGAAFGDVRGSLLVAGATFGEVGVSLLDDISSQYLSSHHLTNNHTTASHLAGNHFTTHTTSEHLTSPPPTHHGNTTNHHQTERPRAGAHKSLGWASHWLVAVCTFYRDIPSLAYNFFIPFETSAQGLPGSTCIDMVKQSNPRCCDDIGFCSRRKFWTKRNWISGKSSQLFQLKVTF